MSKSYVHEGVEVILTGRRAVKDIPARGKNGAPREDELVEITPKDLEDGSRKQFVRMTDMHMIVPPAEEH